MITKSQPAEERAVFAAADIMMAAARTAPKGCGLDNLETMLVSGEDKNKLSEAMRGIAKETGADFFERDAGNVDACPVVILLGAVNSPVGLTDCGFCGFSACDETIKVGANCAFNITDLGIAAGSAVAVGADHRIDTRIMFSAGKAAIRLNLFENDVRVAYGIPLSVTSKSIFFDRGLPSSALEAAETKRCGE